MAVSVRLQGGAVAARARRTAGSGAPALHNCPRTPRSAADTPQRPRRAPRRPGGLGGRALSDAHLEVVTVALPRLRLGRNTLAILFQLSAAVAGSDLQGRLHVEAGAWEQ